jgi:hypothetical protein
VVPFGLVAQQLKPGEQARVLDERLGGAERVESVGLASVLLTTEDLRSVRGLPPDMEAVPVDRLGLFRRRYCGRYTRRMPSLQQQYQHRLHSTVGLIKKVDLGSLGDQRTAALLKIMKEGVTAHAGLIVVRNADVVAVLVLFAPAQVSDDVAMALALRISRRLEKAG